LIGVSFQQVYKYENDTNRGSSGRLSLIAQALGVDAGYFFDGMGGDEMFRRRSARDRGVFPGGAEPAEERHAGFIEFSRCQGTASPRW
jgi:transcriptional regulator with XRE-family HTH domain